jgi:hypothetical protein
VGVCLPVSVSVDAPNLAAAGHAGAAQVIAEARGLRRARMRGPAPARKPPTHLRDSVTVLGVVRLRCPGTGRMHRYTATAALRLAIPVHAPDKVTAWDAAQHTLRTDLARLRRGFVTFHPDRISRSWIRAADTPVLAAGVD